MTSRRRLGVVGEGPASQLAQTQTQSNSSADHDSLNWRSNASGKLATDMLPAHYIDWLIAFIDQSERLMILSMYVSFRRLCDFALWRGSGCD